MSTKVHGLKGTSSLLQGLRFNLEDCLARHRSSQTVEIRESNLRLFIRWALTQGVSRINQIDLPLVEAYRRYLYAYRQPTNDQPLKKSTVRNRLTAVKMLVACMVYHDVLKSNPLHKLELPRASRRLPKQVLSEDEVEKILVQTTLNGNKCIRDSAIIDTYYATGIRKMELAHLKIDDIDFKNEVLAVNAGKGDKDRRVPIARTTCERIQRYLDDVRPRQSKPASGTWMFLNNRGERFNAQQLYRLVNHYIKRAGVSRRGGCNLFRHAAATHMHRKGVDSRLIQEMLGHSDISTTQVYVHVGINELRKVYHKSHPAALRNTIR